MDITKLSLNDLKALAFDEITRLQMAQNNLQVINKEIAERSSHEKPLKKSSKNDNDSKS